MSEQVDIFAPEELAVSRAAAQVPILDGNVFRFSVPGEPVAKGRPRIGIVRGHAMAFTPGKTRSYENEVRWHAKEAWGDRPLLDRKLFVTVDAYRAVPKSFSRTKTAAALQGDVRPCVKPDVDNFAKSAIDALNGVVFRDDALIVELLVRKHYADKPRLDVEVRWA